MFQRVVAIAVALSYVVHERLFFVEGMTVSTNRLSGASDVLLLRNKIAGDPFVIKNLSSPQPSVILPTHGPGDLAAWSPYHSVWSKLLNVPKHASHSVTWDEAQESHIDAAKKVSAEIKHWFEDENPFSSMISNEQNTAKAACRLNDIISSMESFMEFCSVHLESDTIVGYELKISDLHGKLASQCPAYHVDNVPVRWIETRFGPGSVYIDPQQHSYNGPLRNMVYNVPPTELEGQRGWKEKVVASLGIVPSQTQTGKAALLVGLRWSEVAKQEYLEREVVLHKSPTDIANNQGRVLLVLDVVVKAKVGGSDAKCSKGCCRS